MTARFAVGIDIGGTKIAAGLVDLDSGTIAERRQSATDRSAGGAPALARAADLAAGLMAEAGRRGLPVVRIGVGVPELVDNAGIVRSSYNFNWAGLSLADRLATALPPGAPHPTIESDVRAAARAEALYGAAHGRAVAVYVTIGTGISYSLCIDGRPYAGAHGYAIHFASSALSIRCTACGARQEPVVEELASGPALARAFREATSAPDASAQAALAAAAAGDARAIALVEDSARLLGSAIALVVNMLDPEIVVVGGGLGSADSAYFPALVAATRAHIFAEDCRNLPIVQAKLGSDAGIIGAAASAA